MARPPDMATTTARRSRRRPFESVRPYIWFLATRNHNRGGQLRQAIRDRLATNRRLPAQTVDIGLELLTLVLQLDVLAVQAIHVVAAGRHADGLDEREEAEQERNHDPADDEPHDPRTSIGPDGHAGWSALERRRLGAEEGSLQAPTRKEGGSGTSPGIDSHQLAPRACIQAPPASRSAGSAPQQRVDSRSSDSSSQPAVPSGRAGRSWISCWRRP